MADIVIKDAQGKSKTFNGVNSVQFSTAQGDSVTFAEPSGGKIITAELPNVTMKLCTFKKVELPANASMEKFPESNNYGFELNEQGYYESNNKGQDNTYAMCKLIFEAPSDGFTLKFDVINFAESTCDYGIFSNIDTELSQSKDSDSVGVFKSFIGEQSPDVKQVEYAGISKGEHFICVKFVKDGGGADNNDSIQFKTSTFRFSTMTEYQDITPIQTKETGESGGKVEFEKVPQNNYIIIAETKDGDELWRKFVDYDGISEMVCKCGKTLEEYSWDDIKKARVGDYARYMWSVGDVAYLPTFMGSADKQYTKCTVTTFDRARNADGTGEKLMGFIGTPSSAGYKHFERGGSSGVSWIGSLIRKDCLKNGEEQYVYDNTVSGETSGTYYKLNKDCKTFGEITLPDAFDAHTKYYTKSVMEEDGAFITGLPEEIKGLIEQVEVPTWSGAKDNDYQSIYDNTIIITKDWLWLPSDSEIFGDNPADRNLSNYSKIGLEGKTLDLYKLPYVENRFMATHGRWLRSPYANYSYEIFCFWTEQGYIRWSSGYDDTPVALCFCI